jgi:hypothetical protein
MLDVFNTSTPQTANYQEFYGGGTTRDWVKPRGASMVRFMLIGGGGAGGFGNASQGGGGGGSGAITSWIGPAIFIPDVLRITVSAGGTLGVDATASSVIYQAKNGTGYTLLTADGGVSGTTDITGGTAAAAMTNNPFGASGIFTSTAGQAGTDGAASGPGLNQPASGSTFLSGGAGGSGATGSSNTGGSVTPNYGYTALPAATGGGTVAGANGYFITQPILVGCGGSGGTTGLGTGTGGGRGGIGCGGGGAGEDAVSGGGRGGDGAVFIWAW